MKENEETWYNNDYGGACERNDGGRWPQAHEKKGASPANTGQVESMHSRAGASFCGYCGAALTPGDLFCGECGGKAEP